jgi:hypothetical protein
MRLWIFALLGCLLPGTARALGQGEANLSVGAGVGTLFQRTAQTGAQGELRLVRGISDAWALRLGLQAMLVPGPEGARAATVLSQAAGVTWAFDAVNWVPFVDLGVAVADVRGPQSPASQRLGGQAGIGVDYLVSRHMVVSLLGRLDYYPVRLAGGEATRPTQLGFVLHVGRAF